MDTLNKWINQYIAQTAFINDYVQRENKIKTTHQLIKNELAESRRERRGKQRSRFGSKKSLDCV